MDLDGGRLESKRFRFLRTAGFLDEASARLGGNGHAVFGPGKRVLVVGAGWEARRFHMCGVRWRHWSEAGSVWSSLGAELGKVEI